MSSALEIRKPSTTHKQMRTHFSQPFTGGLDCWFLIGFAACTCLIPVLLPSMFSSLSELIKICPVSTCCQRDTTVWLILTHKHTCHNRCFSIGYHGSPVSKATLECWACSTTPFRKEPHVNKAGMCGTVCIIWVVNIVATDTWPLGLHVSLLPFRTWYLFHDMDWNKQRRHKYIYGSCVFIGKLQYNKEIKWMSNLHDIGRHWVRGHWHCCHGQAVHSFVLFFVYLCGPAKVTKV